MAASSLLETGIRNGVFRIVLNRPDKRNALSLAMIEAINEALEKADQSAARVIVVAANGPVFSSGHDLKELTQARGQADSGRAFFETTMRACSVMMQKIVNHRLPVIAEVDAADLPGSC
ncbi:MAG: enoyl-CoA hydratase-related protein [Pseudomonadota bacterium]